MRKIEKLSWLGMTIGIACILSGCAITPTVGKTNIPAPEKLQVCQLSPLALEVTDDTPGQKNQKFVQLLENDLKLELSNNGIQVEKESDKTLKVSLKNIRLSGYVKEFILGPFAGRSCVQLGVALVDKSRTSLADFPVSFFSNTRGISNILKSPEESAKKSAQEIVKRLISLKWGG